MTNFVMVKFLALVWGWLTYVPHTGQDYKDSSGDSYGLLRSLWEEFLPGRTFPSAIPNGYYCPRAYSASDEADAAWDLVYRRFVKRVWRMSQKERLEYSLTLYTNFMHRTSEAIAWQDTLNEESEAAPIDKEFDFSYPYMEYEVVE